MTKKKKHVSNTIINTILLFFNLFGFIRKITTLVELEARLAGRSIAILIVLSFVTVALLTSTWLSLLALLFIFLYSFLHWTLLISALTVSLFNVLFLLIIGLIISHFKKNLSFPMTREQCRSLYTMGHK